MKENFLRRPRRPLEYVADALRIVGVVGMVVAAIWLQPTDAGILAFALPALVAPRFLGVRAGFDAVFCVVVLTAAWSNVIDLYRTVPSWDIVMHAGAMGVLVPLAYVLLARFQVVPAAPALRTVIALYPILGLALGSLWEMVEWAGFVFITEDIFVEYDDTIGDMAVGAVGALVAALLQGRRRLTRPSPEQDEHLADDRVAEMRGWRNR